MAGSSKSRGPDRSRPLFASSLSDPGPGRRRDAPRPRRDPPAQDGRGGRPGGAGGDPAGPLHGPALSAGPAGRRSLGLDAPLVCNSGALVKEPGGPPDALAGRPRRATSWPRSSPSSATATSRPSRSPTAARRASTSWSTRAPTGRPLFDDYLDQNRGHAEVDPGWPDRPGRPAHYHLCAIGDAAGDARLRAGDPRPARRPGPDVRPEEPAVRRDDVRGPPPRRQQVVGPAPPGRALGRRPRPRSAPWATT